MNANRATLTAAHAPIRPARRQALRRTLLGAALLAPAVLATGTSAQTAPPADGSHAEATFDRSMLSGAYGSAADLSRYERANPVLPGTYNADIYVNDGWNSRRDVRFVATPGQRDATACIDATLFRQLGLQPAAAPPAAPAAGDADACIDLDRALPGTRVTFNQADLRLDISVPQAWLALPARGYVSPAQWDRGIPAALLNYNFNAYRNAGPGGSQTSAYLGLNAGLNLGAWQLRQNASLSLQSGVGGTRRQWQNIASYVQRDLPALRAQLTLGDSFTSGELFDSVGIRGVQLATDDRMLPESQRGYAPTIRGVAASNAKVSVRQNGIVIYQTTVAPGPFVIDDLFPTGYGGNLEVSITEANGQVHSFQVPYAAVPQLLRPGVTRFALAAGQVREVLLRGQPALVQGTVQRGFNNLVTGYAGALGAEGYAAALLGSALNTRYGALALDVTAARARIPGHAAQDGAALRLGYSKVLPYTGTSLSVAAWRYATSGYLGLDEALLARDYARRGLPIFASGPTAPPNAPGTLIPGVFDDAATPVPGDVDAPAAGGVDRQRNRFDLSLSQQLGARGGALYANVSSRDYWNRGGTDTQFQFGYTGHLRRVSYSVSATRARDAAGRNATQWYVSLSLPLGDAMHAPNFSGSVTRDEAAGSLVQATLNGSAGGDNQFNYGLTASRDGDGGTGTGSVNGGYRGSYGQFSASYGQGQGYRQSSFGAMGAIVAHAGGILFGQATGDTMAIVVAPDAAGARLGNAAGVRLDRSGQALVPYLEPYSNNTIELDPKGLPLSVELGATSARVAPYAGAVVEVRFRTSRARSVLVRVRRENGDAVPFGAEALDAGRHPLGVVGQGGRALLRGVADAGRITLRWQEDGHERACTFNYALAAPAKGRAGDTYDQVDATCAANAGTPSATGSGP